jgi:hypothetical protein
MLIDFTLFSYVLWSSGFQWSPHTWWSQSLCAPQCIRTIPTQLMIWRWPSQNTFGMWTVLYWTRSSRTQLGVSVNVWRLAGDTLNITCNFLYCNHQVHRDFLITTYNFTTNAVQFFSLLCELAEPYGTKLVTRTYSAAFAIILCLHLCNV